MLIKKVSFNFCIRMELIFMFKRWYALLVTPGVFKNEDHFLLSYLFSSSLRPNDFRDKPGMSL